MDGLLVCLVVFAITLFLGMPIAFSIGVSGLSYFLCTPDLPLAIIAQKAFNNTQSATMLAVPLFIFSGNLMNHAGITGHLVKLCDVLTGHMYGNLGQISCVLSAMMGGCSGSATSDAAMEARLLGPEMTRRGYSKGWSAAIHGWSSLIVATIPPATGLILYGSAGEVSIGRLFTGGIMPGIFMTIALMVAVTITSRKRNYLPARPKMASFKEIMVALADGIWGMMFPIFLIVFLRTGIMTPSESGAFAAVYGIIVGKFIYKELTWESFKLAVKDSVKDVANVMLIIALSGIFGYAVVYERLPAVVGEALLAFTTNKYMMLFLIGMVLIFMGMFVSSTVVTLMMTPIFVPVIKQLGIDPVHFGLIMMTLTTAGNMTPPVGQALYAVSSIMECPPEETVKESIPFIIAILAVVLIMVLFPKSVLWLPDLLFGAAVY